MKRFITYLYAYKNRQKIKNTGYIRVDVRGSILNMQMNIKEMELKNQKGVLYILIKKEDLKKIPVAEIQMEDGVNNCHIVFDCNGQENESFNFEHIVGVSICYENETYMASCWCDGEEETVSTALVNECPRNQMEKTLEASEVQALRRIEEFFDEKEEEKCMYHKVNLNEVHTLPSHCWHFSNNSFLLHGFWNYGYLVFKEVDEKDKKRIALGVPGVFEKPEMAMATYFGFPNFEALPNLVQEMEIGEFCSCNIEEKNQQPQDGVMGCWFTNL